MTTDRDVCNEKMVSVTINNNKIIIIIIIIVIIIMMMNFYRANFILKNERYHLKVKITA